MTLIPASLRVNDVVNPIGTSGTPYFGWHIDHPEPDQVQTRYQLLVASSPAHLDANIGDVWDSGPVASDMQNHVVYRGIPLTSNTRYFWKVRAWDKHGNAGAYSEVATFVVGLLTNDDWAGAKWIKRDTNDSDDYTYYRKTIALPDRRITRATLYISAVHKYELYLDGTLIGTGPSYHYPQYQYYNAYDVTAHVTPGARNVFAILNHWFGGGQGRPAGERGIILKAVIEHAGGSSTVVGADRTWKQKRAECWVAGQPIRNDEGVGYVERIDAAKLIPNWHMPTYDDSDWGFATEIGAQPTPPWTGSLYPDLSRIVERVIAPASIADLGNGIYVVDLGKVYAGRPRITFSGGQPGTVITMRGGYTLTPEGMIDPRTNQNTDTSYSAIASGGEFTFLPLEYLGMRYFQVDNSPALITAEHFSFIVRHAELDDSRSSFTSSSATLNAVWELMKHSVYLGAQEQFLDTPTREKGGFLVDSMNESLAAMSVFGERVLTRKVLSEFLQSMEHYWSSDADRGRMNAVYPNGDGARDIPDFTQAYLVWVWEYYLHTGDRQFLSDHYLRLKSIADYVMSHRNDATGLVHRLRGGSGEYTHGIVDWPPSMRYDYDMASDARTVVNALAYADADRVSRIAAELGSAIDRDRYRALADELKAAINRRLMNDAGVYVDGLTPAQKPAGWAATPSYSAAWEPPPPRFSEKPLITDGAQSKHVSQHANMLPLALGIAPPEKQTSVLNQVKELKMSVGMVTLWWLIRALGETDAGEHLIDLFTQAAWDGWAKNLSQGATSTWESWDADAGGNLSMSHPWGAVGLCGIQQYVLGVKPLLPQYAKVQIKPLSFGSRLTSASGKLPTERGDIAVRWERDENRFTMTVTLPVNVQAKVCVPRADAAGMSVIVDGTGVIGIAEGNYLAIDHIGSGTHTFERAA